MNERIRELAEQQAGSILIDLVMPDAGMPEKIKWNIGCTTAHLEKFAELIVRECADVINDGVLNSDGLGDWYTGYVAGATECRRKINRHFGVEG